MIALFDEIRTQYRWCFRLNRVRSRVVNAEADPASGVRGADDFNDIW